MKYLIPIFLLFAASAQAAEMPQPGAEQLQAFRKIVCTTNDNEPSYYQWEGAVYSRIPGEKDRKLFKVEGMSVRQCGTIKSEEKGDGFRLVSREILLYLDPKTGEVLTTWENPWTSETVDVIHVENDPVNQPPFHPIAWGGRPFALPFGGFGDNWWLTLTYPLFYENELGGPYQDYVGGKYHATEMFNYLGSVENITDSDSTTAEVRIGWARISQFLPWMKMGDKVGVLYFHTAGAKLDNYDQLSDLLKREIKANYPIYGTPPPVDDDRPNETSWTWFKKQLKPSGGNKTH